ncbi:VOC family protein [Agromyces mediolanus]|jgi:predicted enzyme related to lactoylglutathione lyase|uniref:VOC family protein n=1 Tax=Agromyces mediolanus TaxID=41986 RepID=UPI001E5DF935|nr:VOC family protein [Agromyces mediolanus]MCD1570686.1 VOC family protein [Agromyces mediolanus]
MADLVVHFEIHASEPQRLVDFYSELFGWRFTQFGDFPYWMIDTGEEAIGNTDGAAGHGINGGLTQRQGPPPEVGAPVNGCNIVVAVDDVDETYRRALGLGGSDALPPEDMAGVGRTATILDPDRNLIGFISPMLSDGTRAM